MCNGGARVWDGALFSQPMIECGRCHRWFHGPCLGIDITRINESDEWTCPGCSAEPEPGGGAVEAAAAARTAEAE